LHCIACGLKAAEKAQGWRALLGEEDDGELMVAVFAQSAPPASSAFP
jgi:hypothetical protein